MDRSSGLQNQAHVRQRWVAVGAILALAQWQGCQALDNGVGLTPAMGYNTWDDFRCGGINATNLMKVADAMVAQKLPELGYKVLPCLCRQNLAATLLPTLTGSLATDMTAAHTRDRVFST